MSGRALSLTPSRRRVLRGLLTSGSAGASVLLTAPTGLLIEYGLVERFTAPERVLSDRVRLTPLGVRVTRTLCIRQGANP